MLTKEERIKTRLTLLKAKKEYACAEFVLKQDEYDQLIDIAQRELDNLETYGDMAEVE